MRERENMYKSIKSSEIGAAFFFLWIVLEVSGAINALHLFQVLSAVRDNESENAKSGERGAKGEDKRRYCR